MTHDTRCSGITNRDGEHLAEAREEIHALAGMEVVGIATADDQEAELATRARAARAPPSSPRRRRARRCSSADRAAGRSAASRRAGTSRTAARRRRRRSSGARTLRARRPAGASGNSTSTARSAAKSSRSPVSSCSSRAGIVERAHELQAQLMNLLDERVVLLRDGDEILELALELRVALPQHRDLPLDERDRGAAGAMRQLQREHQRRVALEEVGVALEIVGDRVFARTVSVNGAPTAAPLCC